MNIKTETSFTDVTGIRSLNDRMLIQDLFAAYYSGLGGGKHDWFGAFFVDGAELDVNGYVVHGRDGIAELYRKIAAGKPKLKGVFRMMLSNLVIDVKGDNAAAQMLWTQTLNDTIKGPPRLIEQGREYDTLIRQGGAWKIIKRVVIADSNLPDLMDDMFTPRLDYRLPALA